VRSDMRAMLLEKRRNDITGFRCQAGHLVISTPPEMSAVAMSRRPVIGSCKSTGRRAP
jgi:hypothetical protein